MTADEEMLKKINNVIEETRPILRVEGGDLELVEVAKDGVVRIRLVGTCAGCPMSTMTLAMVVERILKERLPEIKRVETV
jgi:Fe-S cluster biogenesis protein NfuA